MVAAGTWHAEQGQPLTLEELINEGIALDAVGALMTPVVEFNPAQDSAVSGLGENEVDMLAADLVEGGVVAWGVEGVKEVGESDLGGDEVMSRDEGFQYGVELLLGGCH